MSDALMKHSVDHPDLAAALAEDADGVFHQNVTTYLSEWQDKVKASLNTGLTTQEFEDLTRLNQGLDTATRVIDFFVKIQASSTSSGQDTSPNLK